MNLKKSLIIGTSVLTLAAIASATFVSGSIYADEVRSELTQEEQNNEVFTFTNADFLEGAKIAYEEGKITQYEYNYIQSLMMQRIGAKGVNKLVHAGGHQYDLYLDSRIAGAIVGLGGAAVGFALSKVPGLSEILNSAGGVLFGGAAGGMLNNELDTSNGIIINYSEIPAKDQYGNPTVHFRFNNVRDQ